MELKIVHFYPDLMSLYGSYANLTVLCRCLELMGHSAEVLTVTPGQSADLANADFIFMGAGTERSQKAALFLFCLISISFVVAVEIPKCFINCNNVLFFRNSGVGLGCCVFKSCFCHFVDCCEIFLFGNSADIFDAAGHVHLSGKNFDIVNK